MATKRIFWDFCIHRFLMSPLHYLSSRSDFDFKFAEIFVIEKLGESGSRWLSDSARVADSLTRQVRESTTLRLIDEGSFLFKHSIAESENQRVVPRLTKSESRRVVFRLRISPRIRSQNQNGTKCSVRDLCQTDLCKNLGKSASLPCPFKFIIYKLSQSMGCPA